MDVVEYLKAAKEINHAEVAKKMWPNNSDAGAYLYRKLSGQRPFTDKDREKALKVLKEMGHTLLTLE
jgi:hypothetical protein